MLNLQNNNTKKYILMTAAMGSESVSGAGVYVHPVLQQHRRHRPYNSLDNELNAFVKEKMKSEPWRDWSCPAKNRFEFLKERKGYLSYKENYTRDSADRQAVTRNWNVNYYVRESYIKILREIKNSDRLTFAIPDKTFLENQLDNYEKVRCHARPPYFEELFELERVVRIAGNLNKCERMARQVNKAIEDFKEKVKSTTFGEEISKILPEEPSTLCAERPDRNAQPMWPNLNLRRDFSAQKLYSRIHRCLEMSLNDFVLWLERDLFWFLIGSLKADLEKGDYGPADLQNVKSVDYSLKCMNYWAKPVNLMGFELMMVRSSK